MEATYNGHASVVAHLIQSEADVANKSNVRTLTFSSLSLFAKFSVFVRIVNILIQSGITALHLAAKANMTKAVEVLLSSAAAFAIINAQDVVRFPAVF